MYTVRLQYVNIHCVSKRDPDIIDCNFKGSVDFDDFLAQVFLKQLAIKWLFNLPLHPTSASTLPGENRPSVESDVG